MSLSNQTNPINQPTPTLQNSPHLLEKGREGFDYKDYYRWMNEQLTMRISSLAVALLGNPTYKRPTEWRWGKKGEVVVYMAGEKIGRFSDFESGVSGDALELVKYKTGYRSKELSDWVKNFIGYQPRTLLKEGKEAWMPIVPVPEEALKGDILQGLADNFSRKGMFEQGRYCYRDLEGNILGYVVRFEDEENKMTLPLTYCVNEKGIKSWRWKGLPVPRLPYGAELLKNTCNTILVVEGEKTAEAAKIIFPAMTILSWLAGTGSVHLTEWSVLEDREVILWPDNDKPGLKCMARLKKILQEVKAASVRIVQVPSRTPLQWDLANNLPEGWDKATLDHLLKEAV